MKSLYAALWAILPLVFFPGMFSAQTPDTFHLNGCAKFWANDHPVNNIRMQAAFQTNFSPGPGFFAESGPDESCLTVRIPAAAISGSTGFMVYGERLGPANDVANGLSVADMVCLSKHILGLEPLPAYAQLAADVNRSNSITTFDLQELGKVVMGVYNEFPNAPSWRILPANCTIPNPSNIFSAICDPYPVSSLPALEMDTLTLVAVKMGDLDGDYNFDGPYQAPQTGSNAAIFMPALQLSAGDTVDVPVYLKQSLAPGGFQVGFRYDTAVLRLTDLVQTQGPQDYWAVFADQGLITNIKVSPMFPIQADTLGYLQFEVKQSRPLSQAIWLDTLGFVSMYSYGCGTGGGLQLNYETTSGISAATPVQQVWPATPNPFEEESIVQVELDRSSMLLLEVWDINGRLTYQISSELPAGRHRLVIPAVAVSKGCIGFYRLSGERFTAAGKVMRK